ncbi:spermidine synthase [Microbacterium sp. E-13]|uniref:spermidine synthase n=1 Tax=Microbacterium sp. E-13 TaxID=3404048 RepID=UPI003CE93D37
MARARDEASVPAVRLSDGTLARVVRSPFGGGWELDVDGTPQSHVDLDDPTHLHFEYVARMGAVIDRLKLPGQPLTAIHLGAGALTIPRYIQATRPGSRQQVVELEAALWDLVRENLPLPRGAQIRVRIGDARETLARLPAGLVGAADLVVSDVYSGAQTPAHLTTVEFFTEAARFLAPDGVLLVNVADGAGLAFARREVATVQAVLENVIVLAEVQTLKGRRFGNLVIAASRARLPTEWLPRLMAAGPHPAKVAEGRELDEFARGARIATDADATPSPRPSASVFTR